MKLVFSEATPDYQRYAFPYVVWGFPEPGESPAHFFRAGFLPSSPTLDRFYLARQVRVPLKEWELTSENRRVLKKGSGLECTLVPRSQLEVSSARRSKWLLYAKERFGPDVMTETRLDRLLGSPVISHALVFHDRASGTEVGTVLLYLERPEIAYYYFAFYDLDWPGKNLGMFMMTRAVEFFAHAGFRHIHLGTCYDERALYKVQFAPIEYSTGYGWSRDLNSLKALVRHCPAAGHLLEDPTHPATIAATQASPGASTPFRLSID